MRLKAKLQKLDLTIRSGLDRVLPRNLTIRYLSALSAVAALAIVGQLLIQNSLARQTESQKRVSQLERQMGISDQLRKAILVLQLSSRSTDMRVHVSSMIPLCEELDKNSDALTADRLMESCRHLDSLYKASRTKFSNYQIATATKSLLNAQTAFHTELRAYSERTETGMATQIEWFKRTELVLLFLTLLVLVLEGLYVFRPSVESLYEALRVRSEFLGRMGHEVRNPMNSILGMANLLTATPLTVQQKKYLSILRRSSEGLLDMLNNLLDFSTVESGKMRIEKIGFNLYDLLCRSIDNAVYGAHAQGIELILDIEQDVPLRLIGDPARLQQVLANLLGNAIKFTPRGEVLLRVRLVRGTSETAELEFSVVDTGIGIDKEKTSKIFDAFMQEDSTVRRRFGGTGLGLSISREIVEKLGGKIEVESEKSVGSRFYFRLPYALSDNNETVLTALTKSNLGNYKAILIEPNQRVFSVTQAIILRSGGTVRHVETLPEVIELFANAGTSTTKNELVIVDYEYARSAMPGLFSRSRRSPLALDQFVFLVKTTTSPEELEKLGEHGVKNFLFKPIKPKQFLEALGMSLGREKASQDNDSDASVADSGHLAQGSPSTVKQMEADFGKPQAPVLEEVLLARDERDLRVLVVDDSRDNQFLIKTYLESTPYRLSFADDGRNAVEKLKASRFDIVLMDLQMPEMDGFTATQMIRAWEKVENLYTTPIIAVSAQDNQGDRGEFDRVGFSDFLAKPVGPATLRKMIIRHVPFAQHSNEESSLSASVKMEERAKAEVLSSNQSSIEAIEKHLRSLAPKYLANRQTDVAELKSWLANLAEDENRKKIQNLGHKLKGNARSYGFDELGIMGAKLEEAVKDQLDGEIPGLVRSIEVYVENAVQAHGSPAGKSGTAEKFRGNMPQTP